MATLQTSWEGFYLDGRTPVRHKAAVLLTPQGIRIRTERGDTLDWPYGEIRQTQGFHEGEQVRLERGGEIAEVLLVSDPEFLSALHRLLPGVTPHLHNPKQRAARWKLILGAALASIAIVIALYRWGIPALASFLTPFVPVSVEEELGRAVMAHLAPAEKQCSDVTRLRIIQGMVNKLAGFAGDHPYKFQVAVLNNPSVNALAAPGGYIVLLRGLIERTGSAEELAGVLAHEMQHILLRHSTRALLEQASSGLLVALLAGDASGVMSFGLQAAHTLALLKYSRQSEEQADREGMKMILRAGIDPQGMIRFFESLKQQGDELPAPLQYLSTHPGTDERIHRLRELVGESPSNSKKLLPNYEWRDMRRVC